MVAISTAPRTWRPEWLGEETPTFTWRVPTVIERELFEGGMAAYNALAVYPWHIAQQFRAGLSALLPADPDEAERLDELRTRQSAGEELSAADVASLDEATGALMQYWPGYRLIVAQASRREAVLPLVAFRHFVAGWEGLSFKGEPVTIARGLDGLITDDVMARIDPMIIRALGIEIYGAMYDRSAEKNFVPPSPSDDGPRTSKPKTRKGGKSAPTSGETTPA
jgi:hypothetical protein